MFEMRLSKKQAEWVIHMDEIQKAMEEEIEHLQKFALGLAEYIGGIRSDIALITGTRIPDFPIVPESDDEFMKEVLKRMNGLSKPYGLEDSGASASCAAAQGRVLFREHRPAGRGQTLALRTPGVVLGT